MMKRLLLRVVLMLLACGVFTAPTFAGIITLAEWAGNIDGDIPAPPDMDVSLFNSTTGLGTITASVSVPGSYFVGLFVDHEIDEDLNTFFNEYGATSGTPAAGQSWEIDEPGYLFGDIYTNFTASALDNSNGVPVSAPDDVSMAIGWDFVVPDLGGAEWATVVFNLSTTMPTSGFYLAQTDPDPDSATSVYFSSNLSVVPLPGAVLMGVLGLGTAGSLVGRFQRRRTQK